MKIFRNLVSLIFLTIIVFFMAGCPPDENPEETIPAPTDLTATVVNGKIIILSWKAVKDAYDYTIYGSFVSGGPFVYIGTISYGTAFYVTSMDSEGKIPLEQETTYYFKVSASAYYGELSSEVSVTTGTW